MNIDKSELSIVLMGLRCLESQTKHNNPNDTTTLIKLDILIKEIEKELGVNYVNQEHLV